MIVFVFVLFIVFLLGESLGLKWLGVNFWIGDFWRGIRYWCLLFLNLFVLVSRVLRFKLFVIIFK